MRAKYLTGVSNVNWDLKRRKEFGTVLNNAKRSHIGNLDFYSLNTELALQRLGA